MKYTITSGPTSEPITLEEAKAQLRVDGTDEDSLILRLISVAREKQEQETGRVLMLQTVKAYWDKWPASNCLDLPLYPAASVTLVEYVDEYGATQTWASSNYTTDLVSMKPRIVLNPDSDGPEPGAYPNAIIVTYVAGESTAPAVSPALKHAILSILTLLYEFRTDMKLTENTPGLRTAAWLQFGSRSTLI